MDINSFLQNLEDFELAFLYKYRYNEFLPDTRKIITDEIKNRNLTKEKINELIEVKRKEPFDKQNKYKQCPFCKSFKIFTQNYELPIGRYANALDGLVGKGRIDYETKKICNICGTHLHTKKSIWDIIKDLFN